MFMTEICFNDSSLPFFLFLLFLIIYSFHVSVNIQFIMNTRSTFALSACFEKIFIMKSSTRLDASIEECNMKCLKMLLIAVLVEFKRNVGKLDKTEIASIEGVCSLKLNL